MAALDQLAFWRSVSSVLTTLRAFVGHSEHSGAVDALFAVADHFVLLLVVARYLIGALALAHAAGMQRSWSRTTSYSGYVKSMAAISFHLR
jgi:hypothetical protein